MAASPYGFWTSPITSDLVVADSIRLEQVALDGDAIYWTETQPQKQGRTFVYRIGGGGEPERVTPDDANVFSVRTRAHEYGGGAFAVSDGAIYFSNNIDQRLYRQDAGRPPSPITATPTGATADALRYADGVIDRRRGRMVCVREDHTGVGEAITTLVAVDLSGAAATQVLVSGNDFYSTPRLSPEGNRMSWLVWRHPDMPWVTTEAWVGDILPDGTVGDPRRVAGGPDESVLQPEWSPDGDLYFVSDRGSGWWNLYRAQDGAIEPMAEMDAEFGRPQWQFGMSTYAFESADRLISCFVRDGVCAHRARVADAEGAHARARQGLHLSRDHDQPTSGGGSRSRRAGPLGRRPYPGSWEFGDGTLVERTTRFTLLLYLPRMAGHGHEARVKNGPALAGHGAEAVRDAISRTIVTLPEQLRRSLTWDQGVEMAQHARLKIEAGVRVYFCDPHSPWQRGTNENTNGLLRQYFPKGTDLSMHSANEIAAVAAALNSRPRKTLDWKTPAEALDRFLLSADKDRVATTP